MIINNISASSLNLIKKSISFVAGVAVYESLKIIVSKRFNTESGRHAVPLFGALTFTAFVIPALNSENYRSSLKLVLSNSLKITVPTVLSIAVPGGICWFTHLRISRSGPEQKTAQEKRELANRKEKVVILGALAIAGLVPLSLRFCLKKFPIQAINPTQLAGALMTLTAAQILITELTEAGDAARKLSYLATSALGLGMFVGFTSHFTGKSY